MAIAVKLQVFEGPLDLLLHLIDKNKIDIYDIPIAQITDQYMDYIRQMDHQDMNVSSEFMLMAATLIDIKCRMLLPKEVNEVGEEEDPREELVRQLLEYKKYKYMAGELREKMDAAGDVVTRKQNLPKEVKAYQIPIEPAELLDGLTLDRLHEIFESILKRQRDKVDPIRSRFGHIEKEPVSVPEKMTRLEKYAFSKKRFSFRNLLEKQAGKLDLVVTFLAVLELMKLGRIGVKQDSIFGDIEIESFIEDQAVVYSEDGETFE